MSLSDMQKLVKAVRGGDRRALGRAITLVESIREDHREQAERLQEALLPHRVESIRVGISGVPGVGKSTFIEALGQHVIGKGRRIAVLAVDPSSKLSGGSILGDKTRMETLSRQQNAFIRPSPAGTTLGGVARRTREAISICEAARYDVVLVETVGVGQSETAVKEMTDMFVLLLSPAGGDELQGMKKGIVEMADMILVNKADGKFVTSARHAVSDYRSAIHLLRPVSPNWQVPVAACSALTGAGIDEAWTHVEDYEMTLGNSGEIAERRIEQAKAWLWSEVGDTLLERLKAHPGVQSILTRLENQVVTGKTTPAAAARRVLRAFLGQ